MNSRKLISNNELIKAKKELYEFNLKNLLKTEIMSYYLLAKDYFEGITKKKMNLYLLKYMNQHKM